MKAAKLIFTLAAATRVMLYLRANLTQSPYYEADEKSELLVSVDGALRGGPPSDYLAQIVGDGNSGGSITTGWKLYTLNLGTLADDDAYAATVTGPAANATVSGNILPAMQAAGPLTAPTDVYLKPSGNLPATGKLVVYLYVSKR